jgi:hypothetical protein
MVLTASDIGEDVSNICPSIDAVALAGLKDAHGGGVGRRALFGAPAVGDAPGNDGVAQGTFSLVAVAGRSGLVTCPPETPARYRRSVLPA